MSKFNEVIYVKGIFIEENFRKRLKFFPGFDSSMKKSSEV